MKKLLAFFIISTLICAVVFAEVSVSAGAGMSFIPIGVLIPPDDGYSKTDDDPKVVTGFGRNGAASAELQVNVEGTTENGKAGFLFQWRPKLQGDGTLSAGEIGDNAELWFKPLEMIRIDAGRFVNNDIRGKVGSGSWFGDYTLLKPGEADIFSGRDGKFAVMLDVKPIPDLTAYAMLNQIVTPDYAQNEHTSEWTKTEGSYKKWNGMSWGASKGAEWIWQNIQAGVGYNIGDIALVRAQFVGAYIPQYDYYLDSYVDIGGWGPAIYKDKISPRIEAAFAFTGVENFTFDIGGKVWLPVEDPALDPGLWVPNTLFDNTADGSWFDKDNTTLKGYSYWNGIAVGLGVKYEADPLTVNFIIDGKFAANSAYDKKEASTKGTAIIETKDPIQLRPHVAVSYKLNETFAALVEGGIVFTGEKETTTLTAVASETTTTTTTDGNVYYGFGAGLQTTLAPDCTIKVGLTYAGGTAQAKGGGDDITKDYNTQKGVFSIPIIFAVSFK
jgi:hypothetical protein